MYITQMGKNGLSASITAQMCTQGGKGRQEHYFD